MLGMNDSLGLGIAFSLRDMFTGTAAKISNSMNGLVKQTDDVAAKIEKAQGRMAVGFKMMATGGAITAAFVPAIALSTQFGRAMGEVSTLLNATDKDMNTLSNSLLNLSTQYGQMPVDQTKALYNIVSTGYSNISDAQKILEASNKAAIAGVTDVNTAFEASVAIMKPYSMTVNQIDDAYDKLFQTVNLGITRMPELSASMSQVTPIAQAVGVTLDELLASISSITATTKASTGEVATQMASLASEIMEGADRAKAIQKKYGLQLDFSSVALREKGMVKFLGDIESELSKLSAIQKNNALGDLFGRREARLAYLTLTGSGAKAFAEHLDQIKNSAGATEAAFKKMSQTIGFQFDRLKSSVVVALIRIGQAVEPLVSSVLSGLSFIVSGISSLMQRFPTLTSFVAQFTLAIGILLTIAGAAVTAIAGLGIIAPLVSAGLATMGISAGVSAAGFSAMAAAAWTAAAGVWAAIAPLALPLLKLVAAILLIKIAWTKDFLGIRSTITKVFEPISLLFGAIMTAWKTLSGNMINVDGALAQKLEKAGLMKTFKNIMMFIYRMKQFIFGVFAGLYTAFEPIFQILGFAIRIIIKAFSPVISIVLKLINMLTGGALAGSGDTFYKIGKVVGFLLSFLIPVGAIFKVIGYGIKLVLYPFAILLRGFTALGPAGGLILRLFGRVFGIVKGGVVAQIAILKSFGKFIVKPFEFLFPYVRRVFGLLMVLINWWISWVAKGFSFLAKILTHPFKTVWSIFSRITDMIIAKIEGIFSWVLKKVDWINNKIGGIFGGSSANIPAPLFSATGISSEVPAMQFMKSEKVAPMLPREIVTQKTNNTDRVVAGDQAPIQIHTNLNVDGRTMAKVVNEVNKKEASRRL